MKVVDHQRPQAASHREATRLYQPGIGPFGEDAAVAMTMADTQAANVNAYAVAGRAFTDDGKVHEHRGLKGRSKGRPNIGTRARRPTRRVPIPSELVALLREHIARSGAGPGGRLFRSQNSSPIQPSTWWRVWQTARAIALTPAQAATPLLRRPYDLRHSGVTWRLNSGVPPTEVAAWAGHSVEVLMRVYAKCMTGLEDVWITRMNQALHLQDPGPGGEHGGNDPA